MSPSRRVLPSPLHPRAQPLLRPILWLLVTVLGLLAFAGAFIGFLGYTLWTVRWARRARAAAGA